jgi:hypothetical protein
MLYPNLVIKDERIFMYDTDATIRVEARIVGRRAPLHTPWNVVLPVSLSHGMSSSDRPFRLCDLLEHVVREEVRAFRLRQEERRLIHVLSPREIADAARRGKVAMGSPSELRRGQDEGEVDEDAAVAIAFQAFEDGLYFVFLDGQQQLDLAAVVWPHPASTLTLIRLVALAGG